MLAPNGFSGIPKAKFCQSCWSKIYTIWQAQRYVMKDPILFEWAAKIKVEEEDE